MERRDILAALTGAGLLGVAGAARAQEPVGGGEPEPPEYVFTYLSFLGNTHLSPEVLKAMLTPRLEPPQPPAPEPKDGKASLARVVAEISARSGVLVVADSTVADERAPLPAKDADIRPDNVDRFIADAIKDLEEGIVWAKFNLPPAPKGKQWTGDDVSAYAMGLQRLYGPVGGDGPEGTVEVIGQSVQAEQATPIFHTLKLQPVYLVTRRTGRPTFHGKWEASYGVLSLRVEASGRVRGNYVTNEGSIDGRAARGAMTFRWFEAAANSGGSGRFTLSEDGESFTGVWWNDGEDITQPGRPWTGKRLSYKP
jgi:hypothetical protein